MVPGLKAVSRMVLDCQGKGFGFGPGHHQLWISGDCLADDLRRPFAEECLDVACYT